MNLFFKTKQQIKQENEARRTEAEDRERYISLMGKIDHVADEIGKRIDLLETKQMLKSKRGRKPGSKNKPVSITLENKKRD